MCSPAWIEARDKEREALLAVQERYALGERRLILRIQNLEAALEWAIRHMKNLHARNGSPECIVATTDEGVLGRVVPIRKAKGVCACGQRETCSGMSCLYVWNGVGPNSDVAPHRPDSETLVS